MDVRPRALATGAWLGRDHPASRRRHGSGAAITYWAFRKRFTHAERVGMELAALDDPTVDLELWQRAASVRVYLADAAAAAWIDLDDPDTRIGVQALEDAGLIAAERSAEILDTPVMLAERPAGAT